MRRLCAVSVLFRRRNQHWYLSILVRRLGRRLVRRWCAVWFFFCVVPATQSPLVSVDFGAPFVRRLVLLLCCSIDAITTGIYRFCCAVCCFFCVAPVTQSRLVSIDFAVPPASSPARISPVFSAVWPADTSLTTTQSPLESIDFASFLFSRRHTFRKFSVLFGLLIRP